FTDATAGRALLGLGACFGSCATAAFAGNGRGHLDLRRAAFEGLFERDLEIVAKVATAILAAASFAAGEFAEQIVEDVGKAGCEIEWIPTAASAALFEGCVTEAIISRALLIILQDVIGFVDFLELDLGRVVARILVGMEFHRKLAIGRLKLGD